MFILDHHLLKQANQLPDKMKQSQNGEFKIWLKNVFGKRVPEDILNRKKWGFASPVQNWIHSPMLQNIIKQLPEYLEEILDVVYVKKLVDNKHNPRYHNMMWTLLVLAIWLKVRAFNEPPKLTINQLFQ